MLYNSTKLSENIIIYRSLSLETYKTNKTAYHIHDIQVLQISLWVLWRLWLYIVLFG